MVSVVRSQGAVASDPTLGFERLYRVMRAHDPDAAIEKLCVPQRERAARAFHELSSWLYNEKVIGRTCPRHNEAPRRRLSRRNTDSLDRGRRFSSQTRARERRQLIEASPFGTNVSPRPARTSSNTCARHQLTPAATGPSRERIALTGGSSRLDRSVQNLRVPLAWCTVPPA